MTGSFQYIILIIIYLLQASPYAQGQSVADNERKLSQASTAEDSVQYLISLALQYRYTDPAVGIARAEEAVALASREGDGMARARANTALGDVYYEKAAYGMALRSYSRALNRCIEKYDRAFVGNCLNNIGNVYRELGIYSMAQGKFKEAIKLSNEKNNTRGLVKSYLNIGVLLLKMKDYDQAMQFFNEILDLPVDSLDAGLRATTYKNVGHVFLQKGAYNMAEEFYQRAYNIYERGEELKGMASIQHSLGQLESLMADHGAALERYRQAEALFSQLNNRKRTAKTYLSMAGSYIALGAREEATEYINRAIAIALEYDLPEVLKDSYYKLYQLYAGTQDANSALTYYRKYVAYKDTIFNESLTSIVARTETRNTFLQHQVNLDRIDQEKQFQKYVRWFALILFLLSGLIVILAFSRLIAQRKANRVLAHQRNILKETLSDLKTSEEKYKALFSQANDAIFLMSMETFIDCNDKTLEIFNCSREDIIGQPPYNFSPKVQPDGKKSKDKALALIQQCSQGKPQRFYWVHTQKDGTPFDADISLNMITLGDGDYIQAIVRDISDRVKAEKEMVDSREKAEKATVSKTFFMAKMSHEIRTMLGGITSSAQLMKDTPLDKQQSELNDIINTSADNLLGIVNEILDMSKIEAGKIELEERPFKLIEILQNTVNSYLPRAREKKIKLYLSTHPRVPVQVSGDELRFRQILNNLISNAIKFTDQGHVVLEAEIVREYDSGYLIGFKISDTGIGIPENRAKDMFSEYAQLDVSISRKYGGSGLGLNIVYKLVKLMKGTIEVNSELNKGTEFIINLPFKKSDEDLSIKKKGKAVSVSKKKYHILLAEDNIVNQRITTINLQNLGHDVDLAVDGNSTWQKYLEQQYDIILMDIQMPEMDGIEVTRMIRDYEQKHPEKPRTRIVALTANILGQDAKYCLAAGMDAFIGKPFKIEDIINKIEVEE